MCGLRSPLGQENIGLYIEEITGLSPNVLAKVFVGYKGERVLSNMMHEAIVLFYLFLSPSNSKSSLPFSIRLEQLDDVLQQENTTLSGLRAHLSFVLGTTL